MDNLAGQIIKRVDSLKADRGTWETHWQDVADYTMPRKADITTTQAKGAKRTSKIYDGTAQRALTILGAGLHGGLTSPNSPWFKLKTQNKAIMEDEEVRAWLEDTEKTIYSVLNSSNFNSQIHELYLDLGAFGTGNFYIAEDPDKIVNFDSRHISECFISENNQKRVDTLYRKFVFTARQAVQEFGINNVGEKIKKAYENAAGKEKDKEFEIIHAVFPRKERNAKKKDSKNMPFASIYVGVEDKHVISESGFQEFPYMVPRWLKSSRETYGRSPAMDALPDVKMLNVMSKTIIKAAQKAVDPPLQMPDDGFLGPVRTTPGGINYYRAKDQRRIEALPTSERGIQIGHTEEEYRRAMIREIFFVDLFLLLADRPQMTATEVLERVSEKMTILGPTLGRLQSELLGPMIHRILMILLRRGMLLPVPEAMAGQEYMVEYVSALAKAQKLHEIQAINQSVGLVTSYAQIDPAVVDNIDPDELVRYTHELYGAPLQILRTREVVTAIRQQRMEAAQAEQAKADAALMVEGAEKVAGMPGGAEIVRSGLEAAVG